MINDSFLNLSILEASPDGIVVTDLKGLVVRASQSALREKFQGLFLLQGTYLKGKRMPNH